ncbi:probable metal-nicotianamine transporter YSL17 [Camellia sinensis]|uniref:probable metal-nicotianamine transporter YSL17 n=1 Tax=Camellia sinensis TaxID=4442 RepID=UPI0010357CBB|nr:probable metal-nicotianamine transporter YSL17 [Camellia sinensis]
MLNTFWLSCSFSIFLFFWKRTSGGRYLKYDRNLLHFILLLMILNYFTSFFVEIIYSIVSSIEPVYKRYDAEYTKTDTEHVTVSIISLICVTCPPQGYCNFLPEEKLLQAVKVGQVVYLSGTASYLLGMSGRIAAQADEASNPINVKNLSLGWMIGFLFLVSFVGLFSIVPLRKMMILKYKLTYPSGTATAYLINSFHTPKGAKLAK